MNIIAFVLFTVVGSFINGMTSASCVYKFEAETNSSSISPDHFTEIINDYALRVVKSSLDKTKNNWFIFPVNVISTLSALYLGSNHTFADEFETILRITEKDNIHVAFRRYWKSLDVLNKSYNFDSLDIIFFHEKMFLSETYKKNMIKYYPDTILEPIAFPDGLVEANKEIWELTNKNIENAISKHKVTQETLLYIVSAAYLKAQWDVGFPITETKKFYSQDKQNKSYNHESMFVSSFFNYKRDKETYCDVVQLNMDNISLSMFLVVPIKGKKIKDFRNAMESDRLKSWISTAGFQKVKINLWMPKESPHGVLSMKGMVAQSLFDKNQKDLSEMFEKRNGTFVDQYLQVGFTEFTNDGIVGRAKPDPDALSIEAVVPFVYFVVEMRTKMVLLAGKYTKPQS